MNQKLKDPFKSRILPARIIWGSVRFMFFGIVMLLFVTGLLLVRARWQEARSSGGIVLEEGDPNLGSAERLFLQIRLATNSDAIEEPVGNGQGMAEFTISPGQNANQIAINLAKEGIIKPERESLLLNYLQFFGLDSELVAGTFQLSPEMNIPTLVGTLINPSSQDITLTFLEGWRVEQYANYLATVQPAAIDASQFLAIVKRDIPVDVSAFSFLTPLGPTDSLEGYLFPDTYRVPTDADALYLINLMLQTFDQRLTPDMRQNIGTSGLSIRDAVTLASIVEREAVLPEEQPTIASVFLNRLSQGIKLDADPTVQYAVGFYPETNSWWKAPLTLDDLAVDSPYNTYIYPNLPPSPIANPGLGALEAVARPALTSYLYFVADCEGYSPGSHLFSETYERHLENVQGCR